MNTIRFLLDFPDDRLRAELILWVNGEWVAASKPEVLGMVNVRGAIPKLHLRLPHNV